MLRSSWIYINIGTMIQSFLAEIITIIAKFSRSNSQRLTPEEDFSKKSKRRVKF